MTKDLNTGPGPAGEHGTHLRLGSATAQAPHGCHRSHRARGSAAARISAHSWSLQRSSSLVGAGCEMEGAEAPRGFCGFIFFQGSCWLKEGVGGIVDMAMAPAWLCPVIFIPQVPSGCLSGWAASGTWGRGGWQCAPGTALHHALATDLLDPIPLIPLDIGTVGECLFPSSCTAGKAFGVPARSSSSNQDVGPHAWERGGAVGSLVGTSPGPGCQPVLVSWCFQVQKHLGAALKHH